MTDDPVRRELDHRLLAEARRRESGWELRRFLVLGIVAAAVVFYGLQQGEPLLVVVGIALAVLAILLARG